MSGVEDGWDPRRVPRPIMMEATSPRLVSLRPTRIVRWSALRAFLK